jgi:hypothetical protein
MAFQSIPGYLVFQVVEEETAVVETRELVFEYQA